MYIGLPGRISQDVCSTFLMSGGFVASLREHFEELHFRGIADGLVLCLDCFPEDGPLVGATQPVRKLKNTSIRTKEGRLVRLPTLHSAGIALTHSGILRCKTQRQLALFITAEIRRNAPRVFARVREFDHEAFCAHIETVAHRMPDD